MDSTITQPTNNAPRRTLADLLPEIAILRSQNDATAKKKPRNTIAPPQTYKKFDSFTIAQMRAELYAVKAHSSKRAPNTQQSTASIVKKKWNSSIKVDKKAISHTGDGQMKHNPVRKVLNFHPKPQVHANSRMPMMNTETPKFPKPAPRRNGQTLNYPAREKVRISGVYKIPNTPLETENPARNQFTVNKETMSNARNILKNPMNSCVGGGGGRRMMASPKVEHMRKSVVPKAQVPRVLVPDTPMSNESVASSCDASFLQNEQDIKDDEMKTVSKNNLCNMAEDVASPPVSTPFKAYRNVQKYFNDSSDMDNTVHDDTIMCFDNASIGRNTDNDKKEESVIVSLCDILNKATVTNTKPTQETELEILLVIRNETEKNIQSQIKLLKNVNKLIKKKKRASTSALCFEDTVIEESSKSVANSKSPPHSSILGERSSVINSSRSPSYKIPKKSGLRNKVFHKSMPEISNVVQTPLKSNKALKVYMQMKKQMTFLNTPIVKQRPGTLAPDTPSITSHNLQTQLDKLFNHN